MDQQDFVIFAEFCETNGAIVLLTIPKAPSDFDSEQFVKRILASDHTRKIDGNSLFSEWSNQDDTHISLKHGKYYSYVHYLTLHDVEARGYARPFCIAYITPSDSKVMNNFELFLRGFMKISFCLRYGNNSRFSNDILERVNKLIESNTLHELKTEHLIECRDDVEHLIKQFNLYENRFVWLPFLMFLEGRH
jgi:hypothetical protein